MTDEKYTFVQEVREKKSLAKSSRSRRTHAGKGGAVRFPHDNMKKKEREKLNGELKTYNLDTPMTFEEFKALPVDLAREWVARIRDKYGAVPTAEIAKVLGCHPVTARNYFRTLNIPATKRSPFDKAKFYAWVGVESEAEPEPEPAPVDVETRMRTCTRALIPERPCPSSGNLHFEGPAAEALNAASFLLGAANVKLRITWEAND